MAAPAPARSDWRTVPNLLSLGRLLATFPLCWLILTERRVAAMALLVAMGVSDNLDGRIARATGTVSELGTVLDPASDRVVVVASVATLVANGDLPAWLGLPVLVRDVAISLAFLALAGRGLARPQVRFVGKAATFGLLMALPALAYGGPLRAVGIALFAAGGLGSFVAAGVYAADVALAQRARPPAPGGDREAGG